MGPIALFDKSFLQSLSVDESVWFDHFFLPVVSPLFFVETLADLAKAPRRNSLIKFSGCVLKRNAACSRDRADRVEVPVACISVG